MSRLDYEPRLFDGRASEMEAVKAWLKDRNPNSRALEIVGPPGIGKTYLLREVQKIATSDNRLRPVPFIDTANFSQREIQFDVANQTDYWFANFFLQSLAIQLKPHFPNLNLPNRDYLLKPNQTLPLDPVERAQTTATLLQQLTNNNIPALLIIDTLNGLTGDQRYFLDYDLLTPLLERNPASKVIVAGHHPEKWSGYYMRFKSDRWRIGGLAESDWAGQPGSESGATIPRWVHERYAYGNPHLAFIFWSLLNETQTLDSWSESSFTHLNKVLALTLFAANRQTLLAYLPETFYPGLTDLVTLAATQPFFDRDILQLIHPFGNNPQAISKFQEKTPPNQFRVYRQVCIDLIRGAIARWSPTTKEYHVDPGVQSPLATEYTLFANPDKQRALYRTMIQFASNQLTTHPETAVPLLLHNLALLASIDVASPLDSTVIVQQLSEIFHGLPRDNRDTLKRHLEIARSPISPTDSEPDRTIKALWLTLRTKMGDVAFERLIEIIQ